MEREGGASLIDVRVKDGRRQSVFGSYVRPYLNRPNLTVMSHATVMTLTFNRDIVTGVQFSHEGLVSSVTATCEVVASLGAINTPKLLMQSGIGDATELRRFGSDVVQHLPGVGRNYQDHLRIDCVWEYREPLAPRNNAGEATLFWKSDAALKCPDVQVCAAEYPLSSRENASAHGATRARVAPQRRNSAVRKSWSSPAQRSKHLRSRGHRGEPPRESRRHDGRRRVRRIVPRDLQFRTVCAIPQARGMPADLKGRDFIRDAASSYWHHSGTAKMGRDDASVVNGNLKVHGAQAFASRTALSCPASRRGTRWHHA